MLRSPDQLNSLKTFMKAMIDSESSSISTDGVKLTEIKAENISDDLLTDLPANIVAHIKKNGVTVRRFPASYVHKPTTQMLIDRVNSIIDGYLHLYPEQEEDINLFRSTVVSTIQEHFNLDDIDLQTPKTRKKNLKKLERILEQYDEYLVSKVINFLLPRTSEQERLAALEKLRQGEIDYRCTKGRPVMINVAADNDHSYITCEIPYVIDADGNPNTQPSYKRDNENLSNSVWRIHANIDANGDLAIEGDILRGASSVPIDVEDDVERIDKTIAIIKQDIQAIAERQAASLNDELLDANTKEHPFIIPFDQLSLLSMLWQRAEKYWHDEQQGLFQVMSIFHAFNLINSKGPYEITVKINGEPKDIWIKPQLTILNIGVNTGRFFTDPRQGWLNRRAFNRFLPELALTIRSFYRTISSTTSNSHADILFNQVINIFLHGDLKQPLVNADEHWENWIKPYYEKDSTTFNQNLSTLETILDLHHRKHETPVYLAQRKLWRKERKVFKRELDKLYQDLAAKNWVANDEASRKLIGFYHIIQDLYTVLDLLFERKRGVIKKHNLRKYNYLLNNALIRLSQRLGHHVRIHCNDGEDRTGRECLALKSAEEFFRIHGHYPRHWKKSDLAELNKIEEKLQHTDVGIQNTEHNVPGAVGFEVHSRDVSSHMLEEFKLLAQRAKAPYLKAKEYIKLNAKKERRRKPITLPKPTAIPKSDSPNRKTTVWFILKNLFYAALFSMTFGLCAPMASANADNDVRLTPMQKDPDPASTQPVYRDDQSSPFERRDKSKFTSNDNSPDGDDLAEQSSGKKEKGKEKISSVTYTTNDYGNNPYGVFAGERQSNVNLEKAASTIPVPAIMKTSGPPTDSNMQTTPSTRSSLTVKTGRG